MDKDFEKIVAEFRETVKDAPIEERIDALELQVITIKHQMIELTGRARDNTEVLQGIVEKIDTMLPRLRTVVEKINAKEKPMAEEARGADR